MCNAYDAIRTRPDGMQELEGEVRDQVPHAYHFAVGSCTVCMTVCLPPLPRDREAGCPRTVGTARAFRCSTTRDRGR